MEKTDTNLKQERVQLKNIRKKAHHHRYKFLLERALAAEFSDKIEVSKKIKQLVRIEKLRKVYKTLVTYFSKKL